MKAEEALAVAKTYVNQTLVGMGALKGAPCTIKSMTKSGRLTTTVFEWTDTNNVKHENTMLVFDGEDGDDGFSPTITVKSSTSSEYILTITDKNGSYDTPNLKGSGGGGGASALTDLTDVELSNLASGDALVFNGSKWANVSLATVATSGSYNDLTDKPTIPAAQVQSDWNQTDSSEVDYIKNKPVIPAAQQSDWDQTDSSAIDFIKNKPTLATVATSGDYDDLTNKPIIPAAQQSDWAQTDSSAIDFIKNKPTLATVATSGDYDDLTNKPIIPAAQQSDWAQTDSSAIDFIKNK
ncbi:MAG: hypothetical protein IIZ78_04995, partial [Clostridiales bacterium]|nr:hypothetical protein [Clostridiales bacterium]